MIRNVADLIDALSEYRGEQRVIISATSLSMTITVEETHLKNSAGKIIFENIILISGS